MLVRAEFLACAVLFLVLAWRTGAIRRTCGTRAVAAFLIAYGLVLVPTTIWHWGSISSFNASRRDRVAGPLPRFAPVTSYGPFNFAMANHEYADGGPNRDHPMLDECDPAAETRLDAGELDLACPAVYDLYVNGYGIGAKWLLTHPGDAIALMTAKAGMTIGFLAHGYFIDGLGAGVDGVRRRVDLVDPDSRWLLLVHLALLAAGVSVLRGRTVALGVIGAPIGALIASTLLFYGYVRLGVAYLPAVWILQGAGLAVAAHRLTGHRAGDRRVIAAVLGGLVALTAIDGIRSRSPSAVLLDGLRTPAGALVEDETLIVRRVPRP